MNNVLGQTLRLCGSKPMTGYDRKSWIHMNLERTHSSVLKYVDLDILKLYDIKKKYQNISNYYKRQFIAIYKYL